MTFFVNLICRIQVVMNTKIFSLTLIIYSVSAVLYSQSIKESSPNAERRDTIELKNYGLSENAKDNIANIFSYSSGYGNRKLKNIKFGTEISGFFYYRDYPMEELYGVSLAIYPGHSFSSGKRIIGLSHPNHLNQIYFNNSMENKSPDGYLYIAPGVSLFSKNRKFSLDLYHKLSTPIIIEGFQPIMPYKVNLHF